MKQDLTQHSDGELSLMVFNDEGLYRMRRNLQALLETLGELFTYTAEQLAELKQDLEDDANEES